jgi:hypothetical protein
MASIAEQIVSRSLRAILADQATGADITNDERLRETLSGLEYFIPEIIGEIHQEWDDEGLDGILPLRALKTENHEVEIIGHCIVLTDQSVVPLHLRLQVSPSGDVVTWLECKLGERGGRGMFREPYGAPRASTKLLAATKPGQEPIDWAYKVTYGERHLDA